MARDVTMLMTYRAIVQASVVFGSNRGAAAHCGAPEAVLYVNVARARLSSIRKDPPHCCLNNGLAKIISKTMDKMRATDNVQVAQKWIGNMTHTLRSIAGT